MSTRWIWLGSILVLIALAAYFYLREMTPQPTAPPAQAPPAPVVAPAASAPAEPAVRQPV
jgi:hypothetical protein